MSTIYKLKNVSKIYNKNGFETEYSVDLSKQILKTEQTELALVDFSWRNERVEIDLKLLRKYDSNFAFWAVDEERYMGAYLAYLKSDSLEGTEDIRFSEEKFIDFLEQGNLFLIDSPSRFPLSDKDIYRKYYINDPNFFGKERIKSKKPNN